MKIYKFYKNDCMPCKMLSNVLDRISIPQDIEIVNIDVKANPDHVLLELYNVTSVPRLVTEEGKELIGMKPVAEIERFINGVTN